MNFEKLIKELQNLYVKNDIDRILKILKQVLKTDNKKYLVFLSLLRRLNAYSDKDMIIGKKNIEEYNEIAGAVLNFVSTLDSSNLYRDANYAIDGISNKILVLSKEEKKEELSKFFRKVYFDNVTIEDYESTDYYLDGFDLIVFDNRDLPFCFNKNTYNNLSNEKQDLIQNRIRIMEQALEKSSRLIIHFGEFLYWINSHRDRVQAANSKFSLHARTKEVIEFINTYRV